jgi:hypothetical protein
MKILKKLSVRKTFNNKFKLFFFVFKGKRKFVSAIFRCFKLPFNDIDSTQFNIPYQLTYETPLITSEDEFFFDHLLQFKVKKKQRK